MIKLLLAMFKENGGLDKMEKFSAVQFNESTIELENSSDIEKLVNCIENEENVIIQFQQENILKSELIVTEDLFTRVKDKSLKITSKEKLKQ